MTYCYPLQMNIALLSESTHVIEGGKKKKKTSDFQEVTHFNFS